MLYTQDQLKQALLDYHKDDGLSGQSTIEYIEFGLERGYVLIAEYTVTGEENGISIGYDTNNTDYPFHQPFHYTGCPHPTPELNYAHIAFYANLMLEATGHEGETVAFWKYLITGILPEQPFDLLFNEHGVSFDAILDELETQADTDTVI